MTPNFFHHILAIDIFQISQDKNIFGKRIVSSICGCFGTFLALFGTFTTRYIDSGIKLKFSGYFYPHKHFI
jgi:hypothetical protein